MQKKQMSEKNSKKSITKLYHQFFRPSFLKIFLDII